MLAWLGGLEVGMPAAPGCTCMATAVLPPLSPPPFSSLAAPRFSPPRCVRCLSLPGHRSSPSLPHRAPAHTPVAAPPPPPAPATAPRRSRLGCQVKCHRYMDGIVLRIPSASNNQQ